MTTSFSATPEPDVGVVRCDGTVLDRQYTEMIAESIPHIVWTASPDGAMIVAFWLPLFLSRARQGNVAPSPQTGEEVSPKLHPTRREIAS